MSIQHYPIALHSPMGPKKGAMGLSNSDRYGWMSVSLIGYHNRIAAEQIVPGQHHLKEELDSVVGQTGFEVEFSLCNGSFDSTAYTSKGVMRLTGERLE